MLKDIEISYTYVEDEKTITKGYVGSDLKKVTEIYQDMLNDFKTGFPEEGPRKDFTLDMVHNMEELAELQKEISKWVRGIPRVHKLEEEIRHVYVVLANILDWKKERGL